MKLDFVMVRKIALQLLIIKDLKKRISNWPKILKDGVVLKISENWFEMYILHQGNEEYATVAIIILI